MGKTPPDNQPLTVAQAKALDPDLARLLAPLAGDAPLCAATLRRYAQPGRPPDRLMACAIIFEYLRFSGR